MTYHRSPFAGLGSHNHNPPWGPSGGAWWRYDQGWTPNIQGPWYLGYPGFPGDGITIRVPAPAMTEATQQAVQLSRQAVEAAERPLWIRAFNWVKENPMLAAGAVMVTALALQSRGMISNAKRPVLHAEQCEGCGETVTRRLDKPFEGEVLCAACKRKGQRSKKPGGYEAALARGRAAAVVATCGDCHGSGLTATGKPCFCPLGDSRR